MCVYCALAVSYGNGQHTHSTTMLAWAGVIYRVKTWLLATSRRRPNTGKCPSHLVQYSCCLFTASTQTPYRRPQCTDVTIFALEIQMKTAIYIFANIAAAPPTAINAAVGTAANGPAPPAMAIVVAMVAAVKVVVGRAADVKGASCTGIAPVKAGACDAAVPSGTASAALGLSTLNQECVNKV